MQELVEKNEKQKGYKLFAKNIIKAKCRKLFAQSKTLSCLVKSDLFFDDILNIFNKLFYSNILPENFQAVVAHCDFSKTDKERLQVVANVYADYVATMSQNGWELPFPRKGLNKKFETKISFIELQSLLPQSREYLEFADVQMESEYIASKIKEIVENGLGEYSDIGVFVDKFEARQKLLAILKTLEIPVTSSIYDVNYENLKKKISLYAQISQLCKDLWLESFSSEGFKNLYESANLNGVSKAQKEICLKELDEILQNLLVEILPESNILDKILISYENSIDSFGLSKLLYSSWHKFNEQEQAVVSAEFGTIKVFYDSFKQNDFASAITAVLRKYLSLFENTELKNVVAGKIKSVGELQNLYDSILVETPQFDEFFEILEEPSFSQEKNEKLVTLGAISSAVKKTGGFKYMFLAGLTENNFPGANISYPFISLQANDLLLNELKKLNSDFDCFLLTDETNESSRNADIKALIGLVQEKIVFSSHSYEAKKHTLPATIFKMLVANDKQNHRVITNFAEIVQTNFQVNSFVSDLVKENKQKPVIATDDVLKLNPSAISTFQSCPRKYYYKNLMNLKEKSNFAASYGSTVHAVFELLNKKFLDSYNKETALHLAEVLFCAKENSQAVLDIGFNQTDVDLICATDDLSLVEMKENFQNAIEDFELSGYFNMVPTKAVCEKSFSFTIDELPNVIFDGRIDAILTDFSGASIVVDYKTGRNKLNSLSYAISDFGVNFKSKTGKEPANIETLQNTYDYQIPIYYLACQNAENLQEYKDNVKELGLLYVRPASKDNGCDEDFVTAERIETYKEKIIQNLKETVVDKIKAQIEFKSSASFGCENCSYKFLCDGGDDD